MRTDLLIIAIVLIVIGMMLFYLMPGIGPYPLTIIGNIFVVIGIIVLVVWVILIIVEAAKH